MDSPHVRDTSRPCEGCGAIWQPDSGQGSLTMNHLEGCQYLEDLEYGGTLEVTDDE